MASARPIHVVPSQVIASKTARVDGGRRHGRRTAWLESSLSPVVLKTANVGSDVTALLLGHRLSASDGAAVYNNNLVVRK